jgi:membrane associated rhomboid family serine protease
MLKKRPMGIFVIVASLAVALIVFLANLGTGLKTAASLSAFTGGLLFLVGFAGRWMFWRDEGDDDWEEDKE